MFSAHLTKLSSVSMNHGTGAINADTVRVEYSTFNNTVAGSAKSWMFAAISSAIVGSGGAISTVLGMVVVGSTFLNSRADQVGGALSTTRSISVASSKFENCSAGAYGGACRPPR